MVIERMRDFIVIGRLGIRPQHVQLRLPSLQRTDGLLAIA